MLALSILALSASPDHPRDLGAAGARLQALQAEDGSFPRPADTLTGSGEQDAVVEATALAIRALDRLGTHESQRAAALGRGWLLGARGPSGTWGATQATVLALEAVIGGAPGEGEVEPVQVALDDQPRRALLPPSGLDPSRLPLALSPGLHRVSLQGAEGDLATIRASFRTLAMPQAPGGPLSLSIALAEGPHRAGDPVRLTATIHNTSDAPVVSPVARIGLPASLSVEPWQLEELMDREVAAFLEVGRSEIVAYWDGLAPGQSATLPLDLKAELPGEATGAASSAWPFYDPDRRAWAPGIAVAIHRP